jgi:hypothetical protein
METDYLDRNETEGNPAGMTQEESGENDHREDNTVGKVHQEGIG